MRQRPPNILEVHVSFEVNRLAPTYLIDAYELLLPAIPVRKPAAPETMPPPLILTPASEETLS
jgi:hypothetical protein